MFTMFIFNERLICELFIYDVCEHKFQILNFTHIPKYGYNTYITLSLYYVLVVFIPRVTKEKKVILVDLDEVIQLLQC